MNWVPNSKSTFQSELPIKEGNTIKFLGKIIAYIIPKDVPNLTQNQRSEVKLYNTTNNKK